MNCLRLAFGSILIGLVASTAAAQSPIVIGASTPLTGPVSHYGQHARWGAEMAVAEANAKGSAGFNEPSPQDAVALHVLVHWRRDAKQALSRVKAATSGAPGKALAAKWLKTLIGAIDLQRQGLSLSDPGLAADAARRGRARIAEAHRLEEQLDRVLT